LLLDGDWDVGLVFRILAADVLIKSAQNQNALFAADFIPP